MKDRLRELSRNTLLLNPESLLTHKLRQWYAHIMHTYAPDPEIQGEVPNIYSCLKSQSILKVLEKVFSTSLALCASMSKNRPKKQFL